MSQEPAEQSDHPKSAERQGPLVLFEYEVQVPVTHEETDAASAGVLMAWEATGLGPTSVKLTFTDRVLQRAPDGRSIEVDAIYLEKTDEIAYGIDTLRERYPDTPLEMLLLLLGAHEATHKAQCERGDTPRSAYDLLADGTYGQGDRHEDEAWQMSIDVFRTVYPDYPLDFTAGDQRYQTHPEGQ